MNQRDWLDWVDINRNLLKIIYTFVYKLKAVRQTKHLKLRIIDCY